MNVAALTDQLVTEEKPAIDADLPANNFFDKCRFEGNLPGIVSAPTINIRKHPKKIFTLDDYVTQGILTKHQQGILLQAIREKKNIIAAGGTKSGKTTFLNALLAEISKCDDRVILIEDTPELQCNSAMKGTYPYPADTELKSIRNAFDKLFATIQFREHDRGFELYSASAGNLPEMIAASTVIPQGELPPEQQTLQVFSQEVLGIELTFFQGAKELHGRYDRDGDRFYVNQEAEVSMDWVMWHEAFHAMKEHEPELYADLLCHAEKTEMFSKQMMDDYRREVKRPCMSDGEVAEELLADAFADRKTGRRMLQDMAKANPALVQRLAAFTQRILQNARRLLHLQDSKDIRELQEKYPGVRLTDRQFRDFSERITENLCSLRDSKNQPMFISKGYRILAADGKVPEDSLPRLPKCKHSPFRHAPQKQKKFDQRAAQELLRHYPQEAVAWAVQELSPLGERMGQYGKRLVNEVVSQQVSR